MDHLTIPIPDGISEARKAEIAGWLTNMASQLTDESVAIDDDPAVRSDAIRRIKQGMAEIDAGQGVDGHEAMRRIAERNGFTLPR
jgi:predicted transcriptional regulator